MPLILLVTGLSLQILDRLIDKGKIADLNDRLNYFIFYYQPFFLRRHFFRLLIFISIILIISDFLFNRKIILFNYVIIAAFLFILPYSLILVVTIFDCFFLKKDFRFNFFRLERELIQQFSLALLHPLIALAYLLKIFLLLFIHPLQGILIFPSFFGLIGFILTAIGVIFYLI